MSHPKNQTFASRTKATLLLADGTIFEGKAIGKIGTASGEICFNTGMTGYQEIFTDPSYYGQLVVMNNVHIGNYGVHQHETESSNIKIAGLIVKSFSHIFSRSSASESLQQYLERESKVGISDIDTRALVRHVRNRGAMNAIISSEISDQEKLQQLLKQTPTMAGLNLADKVSVNNPYLFGSDLHTKKVAVIDFGVKQNILRCIESHGIQMMVFPYNTTLQEMEKWSPSGYHLSNGPGDPSAMPNQVALIREILQTNKPVFGICLGHQLLAEALGIKTYKMKNGHRGINHPVKNIITGHAEITSQNHGFAVDSQSLFNHPEATITHINLNDQTVEGMRLNAKPVFSVQYHPEAAPGPLDSRYLFANFAAMLEAN